MSVATAVRGNILVIDDDLLVGRVLHRILGTNHSVTVLTDGREALQRLRTGEPVDVILCDLMMPEISGMDLHEQLRTSMPDVAAKMIFLSGGACSPSARAFVARMNGAVLNKPFDARQLQRMIDERLRDAMSHAHGPLVAHQH